MQKALMQMDVQLHHVVQDITGVTGMKIIRAIVAGERNTDVLAQPRDIRCKALPRRSARHWVVTISPSTYSSSLRPWPCTTFPDPGGAMRSAHRTRAEVVAGWRRARHRAAARCAASRQTVERFLVRRACRV